MRHLVACVSLLVLLLSCGGRTLADEEGDDMAFVLAPWHMWGTGQTVRPIISALPSPENMLTQQLARVNYKRPESWGFFFSTQVVGAHTQAPGNTIRVAAYFDIIIGLGRSQTQIQQFVFQQMTGNAAALQGVRKWTMVTQAPVQSDDAPTPFAPSIDHFVAEEIQCSARVFAYQNGGGTSVGGGVDVQVEAYFAPLSHIRPEWYTDDKGDGPRFRGKEDGGT